jgi:hypothetical protein
MALRLKQDPPPLGDPTPVALIAVKLESAAERLPDPGRALPIAPAAV